MQIVLIGSAPLRLPERPRTLLVKEGGVWLWPGIPLTRWRGETVVPVDINTAYWWLTKWHGPEVNSKPIAMMLARTAEYLNDGDTDAAQAVLDRADLSQVSPEGAALMKAVTARLDISVPGMPVLPRNPLWQAKDVASFAPMFDRFIEAASYLEKSAGEDWDPAKHPRLGTTPNPGWFAQTAGVKNRPPSEPPPKIRLPQRPGDLPSEPPPELPDKPQLTEREKNDTAKAIARWLAKVGGIIIDDVEKSRQLRIFFEALHALTWLYDKFPMIQSYLDDPKTMAELQGGARKPKDGYETHHIVEQTPARDEGFPEEQIEGVDNVVRIPIIKHWEITAWFATINRDPEFGGLSPREYLRGKDWATRYRVGLQALRRVGVLKP